MSPLRWTCKSTYQLAMELTAPTTSCQPAHSGAIAEG